MSDRRPIFQPNELSNDAVVSMRTRIISAIVAIAILLPIVLVGDWAFFVAIGLATVFGVIEIIRCAKRKYSKVLYITGLILALLVLCWNIIRSLPLSSDWRIFDSFHNLYISITVVFIGICLSAITIIIDKGFTIVDACFIFTIVLLVALGFQSALFLRYYPSYYAHQIMGFDAPYFNIFDNLESAGLFCYVVVGACLNDAFAYFVGVFFGKHKMNPRISPKKTWEGFFGGVFLTAATLIAWAFILDAVTHGEHTILKHFIDIEHWYHVLALAFLIPLVSVLGDLVFSSMKRYYGIKDFGNLMPGHGGVLDRVDSVVFAATTVAIYICIFSNNGGGFLLP